MESTREIFFSYAWGDDIESGSSREEIVNELYESLIADGFQVIRDKNDLRYKGLVSDLTGRIGRGKFIVVAISDKYLKSTYCMLELLEIYRKSNSDIDEMLKKIFPIVLDDAKIYNPEDRVDYLKFWEAKKEALNEKIKGVALKNVGTFAEDLRIYDEITSVLPILSKLLKDINTLNPRKLSANNFAEIKNAIIKSAMAETLIQTDRIPKQNISLQFVKMPGSRALIITLIAFILITSFLYFGHVSTTDISLELSISEVNFTLPKQQVLTNFMKLTSIGASGLRNVQLPAYPNLYSSSQSPSGNSPSSVRLSVDTGRKASGTLALDALSLPAGVRIGIYHTEVSGEYRFSVEGKEINLPVQVNGFVKIALPPNAPEVVNFSTPRLINLQSGKNEVDLDLIFLSGSNTFFSGLILTDSISLLRIDEHFDNEISIVSTVSTILSGTLYFESLPGHEQLLQSGQQIRFTTSKGEISKFELQENHIVFTFRGSVSGMTTGEERNHINLMPNYLQLIGACFSHGPLLNTDYYINYNCNNFWSTSLTDCLNIQSANTLNKVNIVLSLDIL